MAGLDSDILGEARPQPGINIGYLPQEPQLNPDKDVRGNVEEGTQEAIDALAGLEKVYADYAVPEADFDALAKEQARLEDIIQATDAHNLDHNWKSPPTPCACHPGTPTSALCQAANVAGLLCAACCCPARTCCYSTNRPTTSMLRAWAG